MPLTAAQAGFKVGLPQYVGNIPRAVDPGATPLPAVAALFKMTLTNPVVGDVDGYITAQAGPNATTVTVLKAAFGGVIGVTGKPDYPRNVVIVTGHSSSIVAETGVVTGKDRYGRTITEAWTCGAGGTSTTTTLKKSFWQVDSIAITAVGDASANTHTVGTGNVFGFPLPCSSVVPIGEMQDGATCTAGTIVKANPTVATADARGTYAPNATPDGAKDYDVWYLVDDPTAATTA